MSLLQIKNLSVEAEGKLILKGIDLEIKAGSVQALMGPNGSGKSTLAHTLAGNPAYHIKAGSILFQGKDITQWPADKRARAGIFLAWQHPPSIPGVTILDLLRAAINSRRKPDEKIHLLKQPEIVTDKMKTLGIESALLERPVNEGLSGGEKKQAEVLQLAVLEPALAILDETDSGLDIDALKVIAEGINKLKTTEQAILLITHYQRILNYIKPDQVHVMIKGKIVESGGQELAVKLEKEGYEYFNNK
ncbi:MAG: Fe-S cluster assembly ATPase SufC [Patescibacteria group bacterium]